MKNAILFSIFGNKNIEKELELLKNDTKKFFIDYDIYICFTSDILSKKYGYNIHSVLDYITKSKYTNIIYQPLFVIDGEENKKGIDIFNSYKYNFKNTYISSPLLIHSNDYKNVYSYIKNDSKTPILYVTHGALPLYNVYFEKLYNLFIGDNIYFASLEAYPSIEHTVNTLKNNNINKINVKPFFLTSGKHIKIDILGEQKTSIKNMLISHNIEPYIIHYPLMYYKKIREIFINKMILGGDFYK